jgi:N-6 DNA Methylase
MLHIETLRKNAAKFAKEFSNSHYELGEAQDFIRDLCKIFEISHRRFVSFEKRVKKLNTRQGRIDGFIPGVLLIEMKSAGEDLDKAYNQAVEYFQGLKEEEVPLCVLVSDFQNLHLYDLENHAEPLKIKLAELPQFIEHFRFLTGYEKLAIQKEEFINKQAAIKIADLHDAMKAAGYAGKDLETYLVRLLFCLFADDTGLFGENGTFLNYLHNYTKTDGSDLHCALILLFDSLNKDEKSRLEIKTFPEHLKPFPYINGSLFEGYLAPLYFDTQMRRLLFECAQLNWSEISPAIFGSLFQAIMHDEVDISVKNNKRREFGAHYTSEENILKTIKPLFMDDLWAEFHAIPKTYQRKLVQFHQKLTTLNFFDPACGCGNFLIIAYRELRLLELEVIKRQCGKKSTDEQIQSLILCDVDQFHGIDIDESAVQIARVAMWLTDHQVNLKVQELGIYYNRIPLRKQANIVCANALQMDWEAVIQPEQCSFIMGNPPFVGYSYQTKAQKDDLALVFQGMKGAGVLDLVAAWHVKAARYIQANPKIPVAFVSTNSLTQGEQVAILWTELLKLKVKLHFAHRTFKWSNEGQGVAAVHCVIMGFGLQEPLRYRLFDYGDDIKGEPTEIQAAQINPYLVDASTVLIEKRNTPLSLSVPEMIYGSKPTDGGHLLLSQTEADTIREMIKGSQPTDGGHLLLSQEEVDNLRQYDPIAAKYIRPFLGAEEFINNIPRYCLWLKDSTGGERLKSPEIKKRMKAVKEMRLASSKIPTQKLAETPYLFGEIRQTNQPYLLIPRVSSETRKFIPIGYLSADVICGDANFMLPNASLYDFGLLTSTFHNAWVRAVCGRLKSDYRYSNTIVYNNFPFPEKVTALQKQKIAQAAQAVLEARKAEEDLCHKQGQKYSLATLYAAGNMPINLLKAHKELDKAVDSAYKYKGSKDDAARVAFLFELYQELTAPLMETEPSQKPRKTRTE